MSNLDLWMSPGERRKVFERLVLAPNASEPMEWESSGQAALALALAYDVDDPNATLKPNSKEQRPLLHSVLHGLVAQNLPGFWSKSATNHELVPVSSDPVEPLPGLLATFQARERLAFWLIHRGADPWAKDTEGLDALDLAIAAQSRSLADALLRHPCRPDLDELRARTSQRSGREIPWLHTLAYFNGVDLFQDLVEMGWDPVQLDKNGWPPIAWVNNPQTLSALIEIRTAEENVLPLEVLGKAWVRRRSQKLVDRHFNLEKLEETTKKFVRLSAEEEADVELFKLAEEWLAASPSKATTAYRGRRWKHPNRTAMCELFVNHFDWRKNEKSGTAKGQWSLPAAAVWGCVRGEREVEASTRLSEVLVDVLKTQPANVMESWLEEEIRPGLSNRGLLLWGIGTSGGAEFLGLLSGKTEGREAVRKRLEEVTAAMEALGSRGTTPLSNWQHMLAHQWFKLTQSDGVWRAPVLEDWAVEVLSRASRLKMFQPTLEVYRYLATQMEQQASKEAVESQRKAFVIGTVLLNVPFSKVSNVSTLFNSDPGPRRELCRYRQVVWSAFKAALARNPSWTRDVADLPFPFADRNKEENALPSQSEWEAFIKGCSLQASLAAAPSAGPRKMRI